MSTIQKYSIKKINQIRKILLLYIDKDIQFQKKIQKHRNSFAKNFNDCLNIYQKSFSSPIKFEEHFSSNLRDENSKMSHIISGNIGNSFSFNNSIYEINNSNNGLTFGFNSQERYGFHLFPSKKMHINKYEKQYIIIKGEKIRLNEKIKGKHFLLNLSQNLKYLNIPKTKKCLSSMKNRMNKDKNEHIKETILEVKEKQKHNHVKLKKKGTTSFLGRAKDLIGSNIDINNIIQVKKNRKKSLFQRK